MNKNTNEIGNGVKHVSACFSPAWLPWLDDVAPIQPVAPPLATNDRAVTTINEGQSDASGDDDEQPAVPCPACGW